MNDRLTASTINDAQLDALYAERDQLRALIDRGFDQHMAFSLIRPDGTDEQLPCADWCYACRLDRLEAERDDLGKQLDGAYGERAHLVAWLAALHPAVIAPAPDIDEPGWQILYLHSSAYGWQMTWHIHPRDAELFTDVEHVPADDPRAEWDGHSTEQKYNRMRTHVRVVHMNNRLGATSCPVCEGTGWCPSCHTTMRARPDEPVTAGRIVRQFPDERREQAEADVLTAEAVRQMDADPTQSRTGLVIQPYTEHGLDRWAFRCWGTTGGTCDGWLGLGHYTQQSAERERDRHLAEHHKEQPMPTETPDCTATISGPHVPGDEPVHCTRKVHGGDGHVGPEGAHGKTLWNDHHAGAVPHGASSKEQR